ncbi:hypothetical protein G9A89_009711 [Geosiphon pyriformis]|nr:hypothetical protein G9A89_009711 [Geosiphon pyriformis]
MSELVWKVAICNIKEMNNLVKQDDIAGEINSLIAKATNKSSFIILGSDFNENGSHKSASFKKCLDLGLVNVLVESLVLKKSTWENFRKIMKTIDYIFLFSGLINTVVYCEVFSIGDYFDTDYQAIFVSMDLGGLLDVRCYK